MKPDLKNEPLTPTEFENLSPKLTKDEFWESVKVGVIHKEFSTQDGWRETLATIFPDDSLKVIGFIGRNTGIRLMPDCAVLLEDKE